MSWENAIVRIVYFVCEECSEGTQNKDARSTAEAREIARREGFRVVKGALVCKECQERKCRR
jgi:Fe2+ or Zn2+ uptake regulation protein